MLPCAVLKTPAEFVGKDVTVTGELRANRLSSGGNEVTVVFGDEQRLSPGLRRSLPDNAAHREFVRLISESAPEAPCPPGYLCGTPMVHRSVYEYLKVSVRGRIYR